jgi:hypothetical protein
MTKSGGARASTRMGTRRLGSPLVSVCVRLQPTQTVTNLFIIIIHLSRMIVGYPCWRGCAMLAIALLCRLSCSG